MFSQGTTNDSQLALGVNLNASHHMSAWTPAPMTLNWMDRCMDDIFVFFFFFYRSIKLHDVKERF